MKEKTWWTVETDCGTRRTLAVSRSKAIRNVKYRLVMDDRSYDRPRPRDFAEMREVQVIRATCDGDRPEGRPSAAAAQSNLHKETSR